MKLANIIFASVAGLVASASFAATSVAPYSVNLDCSVVTDGFKDSSQIVGFTLFDDTTGVTQTVSSEDLQQHGCEVRLVPNTSGIDTEVAGSIFIATKGVQFPFGYMMSVDAPLSCDDSVGMSVPMHVSHSSPLQAVKACLGQ